MNMIQSFSKDILLHLTITTNAKSSQSSEKKSHERRAA